MKTNQLCTSNLMLRLCFVANDLNVVPIGANNESRIVLA